MATQAGSEAKEAKPQKQVGEWLWRFLGVVMLFAVGWLIWIFYQINPPALITNAAFEAAAKARASQEKKGPIGPASPAPVAAATADAKTEAPRDPPVNLDKLKLSDTIERPIPERAAGK